MNLVKLICSCFCLAYAANAFAFTTGPSTARPGGAAEVVRPVTDSQTNRPVTEAAGNRPSTTADVYRPTTSSEGARPKTQEGVYRPATTVDIVHPSTTVTPGADTGNKSSGFTAGGAKSASPVAAAANTGKAPGSDAKVPDAYKMGQGESGLGKVDDAQKAAAAANSTIKKAKAVDQKAMQSKGVPSGLEDKLKNAVSGKK